MVFRVTVAQVIRDRRDRVRVNIADWMRAFGSDWTAGDRGRPGWRGSDRGHTTEATTVKTNRLRIDEGTRELQRCGDVRQLTWKPHRVAASRVATEAGDGPAGAVVFGMPIDDGCGARRERIESNGLGEPISGNFRDFDGKAGRRERSEATGNPSAMPCHTGDQHTHQTEHTSLASRLVKTRCSHGLGTSTPVVHTVRHFTEWLRGEQVERARVGKTSHGRSRHPRVRYERALAEQEASDDQPMSPVGGSPRGIPTSRGRDVIAMA